MTQGNSSKPKAELTHTVFDLINIKKINEAYKKLSDEGGLAKIVKMEKIIYQNYTRKRPLPIRLRKRVEKGELGIRTKLFEQRSIMIGKREIFLFCQEVTTKAKKWKYFPGGSIDLLGMDSKTGRIIIIELKDSTNRETLLEALLQGSIYRAQLSKMKNIILNHPNCPDSLTNKNISYGVLVLAPCEWAPFLKGQNYEIELANQLLARKSKTAPVFCVGSLSLRANGRYQVEKLIAPDSW